MPSESVPDPNEPTKVGSLDLSDPKDLGLANRIATRNPRRWRMPSERREWFLNALEAATERAEQAGDNETVIAGVRVAVAVEKQNQEDEHRAEDLARLDNGQLAPGGVTFVIRCKDDPKDDSKPELPSVSG